MFSRITLVAIGLAAAMVVSVTSTPAGANNGMASYCVGTANCGMGGAGIAEANDATNVAINPALSGKLGNEVSLNLGWFHPERTLGPGSGAMSNTAAGSQTSQLSDYPDGSIGVNARLSPEFAVALAAWAAGGGETKYDKSRIAPGMLSPNSNAFDNQVRIRQMNMAAGVAWSPAQWQSYGMSLILGYQDFKTNMAVACCPGNSTTDGNGERDRAYGWGVRVGGLWDLAESLSIGLTGATPVRYQRFDKYKDLFKGGVDQPGSIGAGMSLRVTPSFNIVVDSKMLFWSKVDAIGTVPSQGGFGWKDQPVFMLGGQYQASEDWTLRAGWNYGPSPIENTFVFANGLFPAITEHHFTAGLGYKLTEKWELSGSGYYSPENSIVDSGNGDSYSQFGRGTSISLKQYGGQLGLRWKF